MMIARTHPLLLILLAHSVSCSVDEVTGESLQLGAFSYPVEQIIQFKLPRALREVSGLAIDNKDQLFAHNDETGVVYVIDYQEGKISKRFQLGAPPVRDDFEGIAVSAQHVYLVTSGGTIYQATEGADGEAVAYTRYPSKLDCEIEGLTYVAASDELFAACKRLKKNKRGIKIYRWSISQTRFLAEPVVDLNREQLVAAGVRNYQPSGITLLSAERVLLLASRKKAFIVVNLLDFGIEAIEFPLPDLHVQPEGIAIASDGRLLVADEGRNKKGRLSVYHRNR